MYILILFPKNQYDYVQIRGIAFKNAGDDF